MTQSTHAFAAANLATDCAPEPLLRIENLRVELLSRQGNVPIIDDLSLSIAPGETLALVGESGAGKSLSALAIMGLLPKESMRASGGGIFLEEQNLLHTSTSDMRRLRGRKVSMIFQDPLSALNPVMTIGKQLTETIRLHHHLPKRAARDRARELLELVQIPSAQTRLDEYAHRLSGGMRQRVMIAMALAGEPQLLLADEPTTALDVTISGQIMQLLNELQQRMNISILLITHDLHAVRSLAHRVAVMYSGRVVEENTTDALFAHPRHPYSQGLLNARPRGCLSSGAPRLVEIPGTVPMPSARPSGCAFRTRCQYAAERCASETPQLANTGDAYAACFYPTR